MVASLFVWGRVHSGASAMAVELIQNGNTVWRKASLFSISMPVFLSVGCGNKGCGLGVPDLRGSLVKKARIKNEPKAVRATANF